MDVSDPYLKVALVNEDGNPPVVDEKRTKTLWNQVHPVWTGERLQLLLPLSMLPLRGEQEASREASREAAAGAPMWPASLTLRVALYDKDKKSDTKNQNESHTQNDDASSNVPNVDRIPNQ